MMRFEKTLLQALMRELAASNGEYRDDPDRPIDLTKLLPDTLSRHSFLHTFYYWKQPVPERMSAEQMTARNALTTLPFSEVLDYCMRTLDAADANAPFETPTVQQVAWVFEKICANTGSYRELIYDHMGFDQSAYTPLYFAGGIAINNAMMNDDDTDTLPAKMSNGPTTEHSPVSD